jgi:anti-anti-sigma factor
MKILRREVVREITVITLEIQSLDASNAAQATTCLTGAMLGQTRAVVDLGALRYFDVTGFAAILKWAAGNPAGPEVRLCSRSGNVHALLELLQADKVVPLYESREQAMASLRGLNRPQRKTADPQPKEGAGKRAAHA